MREEIGQRVLKNRLGFAGNVPRGEETRRSKTRGNPPVVGEKKSEGIYKHDQNDR